MGSLAGCASLFDIERADGLRGPADENATGAGEPAGSGGSSESGPASVVSSAAPGSADPPPTGVVGGVEEEAADPLERGEEEEEPDLEEPDLEEPDLEEPDLEGGEVAVPDGVERLPAGVGLDGAAIYTLTARGSTMSGAVTETGLCVKGSSVVLSNPETGDPDYANSWGAALKVYTAQWQPAASDRPVVGLSFDVVGELVPAMRFQAFSGLQPFCAALGAGAAALPFSELQSECYNNVASNPVFSAAEVTSFEWQVFGVPTAPKLFDFCVENIEAIYEEQAAEDESEAE